MDPATAELVKLGLQGIVILGLSAACIRLWRDNKESQQQRIDDMKAVNAKMLENNTQCVTALTTAANAMEAQAEGTRELKDALKGFGEELRRRRG